MIEEAFHEFHGNGKAEAFAESDFHIGHADDFAGEIEERAAAVAGVDLRAGLQIQIALHLPRFGADDALRDGAFQAERTADGEYAVAHVQSVRAAERDGLELRRVFILNVQEREVVKFVDGDNFYLLVGLAVELAIFLLVNFHGNFRLALDDVEIGDEITVFVQEEAGTKSAGGLDLHHGFADLLDEGTHVAGGGSFGGGCIKLSGHSGGRGGRSTGGRGGFGNAHDGATRYYQCGVTHVHDQGVRFLGENFPSDGRSVLELNVVGQRELRAATEQRCAGEMFFQRHGATIDHRLGFDKRTGVQSYAP